MRLAYVSEALGLVLKSIAVVILVPCLVALYYKEYNAILPFVVASVVSLILGVLMDRTNTTVDKLNDVKKTEALFIVSFAWILFGCVAAIPYLFFKIPILNALFEAVSGITTTGASILDNLSIYPKTMLFWRSFTQWLGGMGIIVLFIAVLPQFAVAGRQMFSAEVPGPTEDKITPRIRFTANALWKIYATLTVIEIIVLKLLGMPMFDAVCTSLSTLAAGGFSPQGDSVATYGSSAIMWVVAIFMFLAGTSFAMQYRVVLKRNPLLFFHDEEFRFYASIILIFTVLVAASLILNTHYHFYEAIKHAFFNVISIITSTGFASADYLKWDMDAKLLLFILMFVGGCAGSTAGGLKVVRVLFVFKYLKREISKILHPNAVLNIKINKMVFPDEVSKQIIGFVLFYLVVFAASAILITIIENNYVIGATSAITSLGNTGPVFGLITPYASCNSLHDGSKIIFMINMIVGRLELIPFLAMLHPDFWGWKR